MFEDIKNKTKMLRFSYLRCDQQALQSKDSPSGYYAQVVPALV